MLVLWKSHYDFSPPLFKQTNQPIFVFFFVVFVFFIFLSCQLMYSLHMQGAREMQTVMMPRKVEETQPRRCTSGSRRNASPSRMSWLRRPAGGVDKLRPPASGRADGDLRHREAGSQATRPRAAEGRLALIPPQRGSGDCTAGGAHEPGVLANGWRGPGWRGWQAPRARLSS